MRVRRCSIHFLNLRWLCHSYYQSLSSLKIKSFRKILADQKFWLPDQASVELFYLPTDIFHLPQPIGQALVSYEVYITETSTSCCQLSAIISSYFMQTRYVSITFIFTERSNSENQAARASAIHRRSNAVVPRDTGM